MPIVEAQTWGTRELNRCYNSKMGVL